MKRTLVLCLALLALLGAASPSYALLGGFENADGYVFAYSSYFSNWVDVAYYNAGQWGANAGGAPLPVEVNFNTGLWKLTSSPGSFFDSTATRLTWAGSTAPYPPTTAALQAATIPAYFIGNHFGGRLGTTALALRNATVYGPITYDYRLDTYDFGGPAPASVTSGTVRTGFYFQPNPGDTIVNPNGQSPEKFIMSFTDGTGSVGLQWGYARDNSVQWRPGNSGPWTNSGIISDDTNYDGVTVDLNLTTQTFKIDYFDISTATTTTIAPAGTALGNSMSDLTHLGWSLTDNLYSGVGGKNFFDDFSFRVVPEPATLSLVVIGGLAALRKRRIHR
ncbi:MAG: PEP-CTERM sorting domain-containing protein [Planctomycetota bacterium]|nr:PEP-CTERM sorting domain-containing protein [Planctomycetota bacterium]